MMGDEIDEIGSQYPLPVLILHISVSNSMGVHCFSIHQKVDEYFTFRHFAAKFVEKLPT